MHILQSPINIVNIPYLISNEFRRLGIKSDTMELYKDIRQFNDCDYCIYGTESDANGNFYINKIKLLLFTIKALFKYDVFIFHWRWTLLPNNWDIKMIQLLRKNFFIYHHGRDVETIKDYYSEISYAKGAKKIFVSTPNLLSYTPKSSVVVPQAINVQYLNRFIKKNRLFNDGKNKAVIITHAITLESQSERKGSELIIKCIEKLKKIGYRIDFRYHVGLKHKNLLKEIANADIHIDQVVIGWYGKIAAEAMAMNTPTVCYIKSDYDKNDQLPIYNVNKENLFNRLENLIIDIDLRKKLANNGRKYILKTHDVSIIAKQILSYI